MTLKNETGGVGKDTASQNQKQLAATKVNPKQEKYNPYRADKEILILPLWLLALDISLAAKVLYGLLRRYAGNKGVCFPSVNRLAAEMRLTPRRVTACLKELVEVPLITRDARFSSSSVTYFVNPKSLEGVKKTSVPPEENFLTPLKKTSSKEGHKDKAHSKGLVSPAAAGASAGKNNIPLEEKKNASGLESEEKTQTTSDFSSSKPDSAEQQNSDAEVIELLLSFYPKVHDPDGTRIVLRDLVLELNDENELNYIGGVTQYFAQMVLPLKPYPKVWNYVPGSYNWFKKRIWETWTPAQMKSWVNEKLKEVGIF